LPDHRLFQHVVEFRVEDVGWLREVNVAQAEPLADEVLGEGGGLGVVEHALDLLAQNLWIGQGSRHTPCAVAGYGTRSVPTTLLSQTQQFLIRHRAPKEIRESARQGEIVERRSGASRFGEPSRTGGANVVGASWCRSARGTYFAEEEKVWR